MSIWGGWQRRICGEKCPQDILISEWMPIVHDVLGKGMAFDPSTAPV